MKLNIKTEIENIWVSTTYENETFCATSELNIKPRIRVREKTNTL
jgi:hypothetical protein